LGQVTRIDVARVPHWIDIFFVILFSGERKLFEIGDDQSEYEGFKEALLKQWPEIEPGLTSVFTGPPDVEEYATLWKREG